MYQRIVKVSFAFGKNLGFGFGGNENIILSQCCGLHPGLDYKVYC